MNIVSTEPWQKMAEALRRRVQVIGDRELYERDAAAHLQELKAASAAIESSEAALPRPLHPDLAHYLQKRSYDKALAWIEEVLKP